MTPIPTHRLALVSRALRLRCPHCGQRGAIHRWFTMRTICPRCGISLTAGNSVGANPFSRLLFVAIDLAMHPDASPDFAVHGLGKSPD